MDFVRTQSALFCLFIKLRGTVSIQSYRWGNLFSHHSVLLPCYILRIVPTVT